MTREEWLRKAVDLIDAEIFNGALNVQEHPYQVSVGWTNSKRALGECIQPYDGEDVTLDDFFPTTIHIQCTVKDPIEILGILVHECIHGFMNIHNHGKQFKKVALGVGFETPVTECHIGDGLKANLRNIYEKLGEYPGKPVILHPKPQKEKKSNMVKFFCPECGFELKTTQKMFKQHGQVCPTCVCGAKMGIDGGEENEDTED